MENKNVINAKCPSCGAEFNIVPNELKVKCPTCGEELSSTMARKYYESLHANKEESKEAHGEDYQKLNLILDELNGYLKNEDFVGAEEKFNEALTLTDTDYRVYMAMVAIKTKNYTDLKDEEHKDYINKAIACADAEAKKEIVRTYKPYYHKMNLTEEELESYSVEENKVKKARLEKGLKSMIPEFMAKEKNNKWFLILFPILIVVGIAVVGLAVFIEDLKWFSILGAGLTIVGYILFRTWFLNRDRVRAFNSLLDFYDFVEGRNYSDEIKATLYKHMQNLCDKFLDNIPTVTMSDDTAKLIDYLILLNDSEMNEFLLKDKYFSQFVSEGD